MPFQKGHKYGERNKGVKKAKTQQWENIGAYLATEGAHKYIEILKNANGEEYLKHFEQVLEYFKPKLARQEHTGKDGGPIETYSWKEK